MKVFIVGSGEVRTCGQADIVQISHPKQGSTMPFMMLNDKLFEIQRLRHAPSSWIFGSTIIQDGSIFMASKFDATFLAISSLISFKEEKPEVARRFCAPSEVLSELPLRIRRVVESNAQLDKICDTQDVMESTYIRLNEDKLNAFLRKKVDRIQSHLDVQRKSLFQESEKAPASQASPSAPAASSSSSSEAPKSPSSSSSASSSTSSSKSSGEADKSPFEKSSKDGEVESAEEKVDTAVAATSESSRTQTEALQIIAEYMPCDLFDVFVKKEYGISSSTVFGIKKRGRKSFENSDPDVGPAGMRDMFDDEEPKKKESAKKKPKKSRSEIQLAKVNTKGMKSLASYFGKPKKQK